VTIDARDHRALARFYLDLIGGEMRYDSDDWTVVKTSDGYLLGFQPAPDHVPPRWPSQEAPQQLHLDIDVPDVPTAVARAEKLGATRIGGEGDALAVMADPAGHPFCLFNTGAETDAGPATNHIRVFGIVLDCPDPRVLSEFYAQLLGMQVKQQEEAGAWIADDGPLPNVMFQGVAGYRAPNWPDPRAPQQMHLDVKVEDVEAAEARVLQIGGTRLPGEGDDWRVFADPAGHPFCLVFNPK
jgi:predicted enzyme related to lactoylglutathione lyase